MFRMVFNHDGMSCEGNKNVFYIYEIGGNSIMVQAVFSPKADLRTSFSEGRQNGHTYIHISFVNFYHRKFLSSLKFLSS